MNKIHIVQYANQVYMIWVFNDKGSLIASVNYIDEDFLQKIVAHYEAEIVKDERAWYQIDTVNGTWEIQTDDDDEETYISGNLYFEDNKVVDYDGCFDLPKIIKDGLVRLGYDISEIE